MASFKFSDVIKDGKWADIFESAIDPELLAKVMNVDIEADGDIQISMGYRYPSFRENDSRYHDLDQIHMNWIVDENHTWVVGLYNTTHETFVECFGIQPQNPNKFRYGLLKSGELPAYAVWESFDMAFSELYEGFPEQDIWDDMYNHMDDMVMVRLEIVNIQVEEKKLVNLEIKPDFLSTETISFPDYAAARDAYNEQWA